MIDTFSGGAAYQPMFYAVAAAVIGGTAMLGGSGTMIGAFLGAVVLAVLTDGFEVIGVSAYPLHIFFGGAILIAMIANVQLARLRGAGESPVTTDSGDTAGVRHGRRRPAGRGARRAARRAHRQALRRGDRADATSTCGWPAARCSACSATTARASRPC